jgi:hypothetical protein
VDSSDEKWSNLNNTHGEGHPDAKQQLVDDSKATANSLKSAKYRKIVSVGSGMHGTSAV